MYRNINQYLNLDQTSFLPSQAILYMPGLKLLFLITLTVSPNIFDIDISITFWLGTLNFIFTFELNGFGYAGNKKVSSGTIGSGLQIKTPLRYLHNLVYHSPMKKTTTLLYHLVILEIITQVSARSHPVQLAKAVNRHTQPDQLIFLKYQKG